MAWWMTAALCAFYVKGLCGFANTLVFSTILSFGSSNLMITPVELLLGFPTNLIIAWRERRSVQWSLCIPLIALMLAGNIPGLFLLKNTVFPLKGIEQIEGHGIVLMIIPDLNQVDSGLPVKKRVVQIKPVPLPQNLVPVSHVKIQITAGPYQSVHLFQSP